MVDFIDIEDDAGIEVTQESPVKYALGIDLGTTNSVSSILIDEEIKVLCEVKSILSNSNGQIQIGKSPEIASSKTHLGTDKVFTAGGEDFTPKDVACEILKHIKKESQKAAGMEFVDAIITIPAYFNENQRALTKEAAQDAGLNVLRLINEPTAAAYSYGIEHGSSGKYAVFDLGGGTFDVSILDMQTGFFKVIATGGDANLGGNDFDDILANYLSITPEKACEIKHQLSSQSTTPEITRDKFDEICLPLVHRMVGIFKGTMHDANLSDEDLMGIIMVGGATRMPIIKEALQYEFKTTVFDDLDPDKIVSYGAAIQANNIVNRQTSKGILLDITPLSLGLEVMGGTMQKIISRNSPIPIAKAQNFTTYEDNQKAIIFNILQGEREMAEDVRSIGKFIVSDLPPMPAGIPKVKVTFEVDVDGILTVSAHEEISNTKATVTLNPTYQVDFDSVRDSIFDSVEHGKEDFERKVITDLITEVQISVKRIESMMKEYNNLLEDDVEKKIRGILENLTDLFDKRDKDGIEAQFALLHSATEDFINKVLYYEASKQNKKPE